MNNSPLYSWTKSDFIKGAITAVVSGVVVAVATVVHGVFGAPGFDVFSIDWVGLGHDIVNVALIGAEGAFSGYMLKNLFTNENGDVPALGRFGKWGN